MQELFQLHSQLVQDTFFIQDLSLSRVLLMNDKRFPWVILVPRKNNLTEVHQLTEPDLTLCFSEVKLISKALQDYSSADKMNIAALGNRVPQLHIHVIARKTTDAAWPKAVFGHGKAIPYSANEAQELIENIKLEFQAFALG